MVHCPFKHVIWGKSVRVTSSGHSQVHLPFRFYPLNDVLNIQSTYCNGKIRRAESREPGSSSSPRSNSSTASQVLQRKSFCMVTAGVHRTLHFLIFSSLMISSN